MHRARRRVPPRLAVIVLVALACLPARAAEPAWTEVRSPHFTVLTDAGDKQGREVALRFEQMRSVFGMLFQRAKISTPAPLEILAFRNSKGFKQVLPLWKGKPVEVTGYYVTGQDREFIALDLSAEDAWRVVFHEYAHLLLNANYPITQPWFDEGFAEYYSTIQIGSKEVHIGDAPEGDSDILSQSRMPLVELFSVRHDSKAYNESGDKRTMFYAQSWLVVHYLMDMKKFPLAGQYFDLVQNQGVAIPDAIARAFGMDAKQMEKDINDYSHSSRLLAYTFPLPEGMSSWEYKWRKLEPLEVEAVIADMQLHSADRLDQGIATLESVLQQQPDNPVAHRGLGYAYLRKQDFARAGEHFRRAANLDPTDPRVLYYAALLMNMVALTSGQGLRDAVEMKRDLDAALALDPSFADAWSLLGFADQSLGDDKGALEAIKKAIQLSPRNQKYQFNLAQFYMRQKRWDDAEGILERLRNSSDPLVASQVAEALRDVQLGRENRTSVPAVASQPSAWPGDAPQWRPAPGQKPPDIHEPIVPEEEAKPDTRPIRYLKGKLVSVDCSGGPGATLRITSAGKTLELRAADRSKLVLIGAEQFSCSWSGRNVAVNYKPGGGKDGDLVSLELLE